VIHIALIEARDIGATGADHVDGEFFAQALNLLGRNAEEREHAALPLNETEVAFDASVAQATDHQRAVAVDAIAHGGQFTQPLCFQSSIVKDLGDDQRAMRGWHGVVVADCAEQVGLRDRGLLRIGGDHADGTDPFAVQTEVL
jgi:hypothetical protein